MKRWQPSASPELIRKRARLLSRIRAFFQHRGITEVTTPVLTASGITDVNIESLALAGSAGYLRTSPEYYHKRLLAAGFGDLYEIGPVFRAGERGRLHDVEFTLLEWYRVGWSWEALAREVVSLINHVLPGEHINRPVEFIDWRHCVSRIMGSDVHDLGTEALANRLDGAPAGLDRNALLDFAFATRIQPQLPSGQITVVHHYPASQAALARLVASDPSQAERFEVFLGPVELANGYGELTDAAVQADRFKSDLRIRRAAGKPAMPIDELFLEALESGLPDCSGVALGVDRLIMLALEQTDLAAVTAFPNPLDPADD